MKNDMKQTAYDELDKVLKESREIDGDMPRVQTIDNVRRFIEALPSWCPMPSVGIEPDGHLSLEWYSATNWILSVSVDHDGMLYYAALLGDEDPRGTCRFDNDIPDTILYWIRRWAAKDGRS